LRGWRSQGRAGSNPVYRTIGKSSFQELMLEAFFNCVVMEKGLKEE
jgi:hypothetical protein